MDRSTFHVPNLIIFYVIWIWTMIGVSKEWLWFGPAVALLMVIGHLFIMHHQGRSLKGFSFFAMLIVAAGITVDTFFMSVGLFKFSANPFHDMVSPPWMMVLWLEVALCLFISAREYFHYVGRMAVSALIGSSLFYAAMGEFSALFKYDPVLDTTLVGLVWALVLPLCLSVHRFVAAKV